MPLDKMTKSIDSKSDFEDLNSSGSTSGMGGSSGADTSPIELESYMKVLF